MFGTVFFVVLAGLSITSNLNDLGIASDNVAHSQRIVSVIDKVFGGLRDAEADQKGYIITGDADYLQPYSKALNDLPSHLKALHALVNENPSSETSVLMQRLDAAITQKLHSLHQISEEITSSSSRDLGYIIKKNDNPKLMDSIRSLTSQLHGIEEQRLTDQKERFNQIQQVCWKVAIITVFSAIILILLTVYLHKIYYANQERLFASDQSRLTAEEALNRSEQQLRILTDTLPQMIWSTDAHGYHDYFNERWYEYTCMPRTGAQGWNWKEYLHPGDFERTLVVWNESLATGKMYEIEYRFKDGKTGEYRWFIGRALPIYNNEGKIIRWFGSCTDVHDQKTLGEEREQFLISERQARADAERAVSQKDEFVAVLSHELRGPLNAILGWTQLMQATNVPQETAKRGVGIIERNARIQAQLISDLFDIHRISTGKLTINQKELQLRSVLDNACDAILPQSDAKGITLHRDFISDLILVSGDDARLNQVITNLLTNSVKFTPEKGVIDVRLTAADDSATITISDNGIGIDAVNLPLIFQRYRQGESGTGRKHGGLGLGLAIVKSIVEMHGGEVSASSEGIGHGSTFTIVLPRTQMVRPQTQAVSGMEPLKSSSRLLHKHILFIEDQDDAREAVTHILGEYGAVVHSARSAHEALNLLSRLSPDLIISDISMPDMDGYSFIREVRKLHPAIPALALTAYSREEDRTKALQSGFNAHMAKPVDSVKLIAALSPLVGSIEIEAA